MNKKFILGYGGYGNGELLIGCASTDSGYFSFSIDSYNLVDLEKYVNENAQNYIVEFLDEGTESYISQFISHYFMDYEDIAETIYDNMSIEDLLEFLPLDLDYSVGVMEIKGVEYRLNGVGWGQVDFRSYSSFVDKDKKLNDFIYKFWRDYHLVDNDKIPKEEFKKLEEKLENVKDYKEEIEEFVKNNFAEIEKLN